MVHERTDDRQKAERVDRLPTRSSREQSIFRQHVEKRPIIMNQDNRKLYSFVWPSLFVSVHPDTSCGQTIFLTSFPNASDVYTIVTTAMERVSGNSTSPSHAITDWNYL